HVHAEGGDEAPVRGNGRQGRRDARTERAAVAMADDEGDNRGGGDRLDPIDVAEDGRAAVNTSVEGEQGALGRERGLVGKVYVSRDVAAADKRASAFLERPSGGGITQLGAVADRKAAVEEAAVAVHLEAEAEEPWRRAAVGGADLPGDLD